MFILLQSQLFNTNLIRDIAANVSEPKINITFSDEDYRTIKYNTFSERDAVFNELVTKLATTEK
jgi:hypothetical protein